MPRPPPSRLKLVASARDAAPLSAFIAARGGVSEELARGAIERGGAFLRGKRVRDAAAPVREGDLVEVSLRESARETAPAAALDGARVLHLDEHLLAVDKPAGVLAQEGRDGGESLPDLCAALLRARGEPGPALLVHRLDRGTTGVTLLARDRAAQAALLEEFREGRVEKEYLALVAGAPPQDPLSIDLALGADPAVPGKRRVDPKGESAHTNARVVERFGSVAALLAARPTTGRTHQIRVHLAALGHPLLGDARYGGPRQLTRPDGARLECARPLLHALSLRIAAPGGPLQVRAPEPADLLAALRFLRAGAAVER